jgi:hypothetical protein
MRRARAASFLLPVVLLGVGACAGPREQIIEDRFDLAESSSTPVVTDIADLGGDDVPLQGLLSVPASDGVAVIGETLWIHGHAFGRQPAVSVGGRPAAVLARTRDGGILVRVPPLTAPGPCAVVVTNDVSHGEKTITVRRLAAVLDADAGQLAWAELGAEGPRAAGTLVATGKQFLALSPDGRAAYLVDGARSRVDVVDVAANGGPKVVTQLDLGKEPVVGVAVAARAWTLAVVRANDVVVLDLSSPLRPARSAPRALPKELFETALVAMDLSPDGKLLAVASDAGNRVSLIDISAHGRATLATTVAVLPDVRESVLADVAFSPLGDTLWIAAGDTPRSRASGPQPTQVLAARLEPSEAGVALRLARTVTIPEGAAPARIAAGRTLPMASGSAIRLPPERTTIFLSALAHGGAIPAGGSSGAVFRVGAEDTAATMLSEPGHFGQPDLSPDGRWMLAPLVAPDGAVRLFAVRADARPGVPQSIPLLGPGASPARSARRAPSLRVQP